MSDLDTKIQNSLFNNYCKFTFFSEVYPGPTPLSEPECAHLAAYMYKNKNNLKAYLTLHAYGNLIIHGWNYAAKTYPDNVEELRQLAEKMVKAIAQEGGAPFRIGSAPDILCKESFGFLTLSRDKLIKNEFLMIKGYRDEICWG